jgi:membrane-bound serine protease (ClpP class)
MVILFVVVVVIIILFVCPLLLFLPFSHWLTAKGKLSETASVLKDDEKQIIGNIGISTTVLRPIGKGKFNDKTIIVEADNQFIEEGEEIKIISIEGNKILVEKI